MSQFNERRQYAQTAQEVEYPTPPPPIQQRSGHGAITMGLSVVAVVMFASLFFSGFNVAVTVVSTIVFYGGVIVLVLLIDSGTLGYMFGKAAEERTKREEMRLAYWHEQQRWRVADNPQLPYTEPAPSPQPALPVAPTFVSPVAEPDDSVRREALAWLLSLYDREGNPDPKKVLMQSGKERPGRIRISAPSRPAKEWLLQHGILRDLGTGYRLNLVKCPTVMVAQNYFSRLNGVGGLGTDYHPRATTPLVVEQEAAQ